MLALINISTIDRKKMGLRESACLSFIISQVSLIKKRRMLIYFYYGKEIRVFQIRKDIFQRNVPWKKLVLVEWYFINHRLSKWNLTYHLRPPFEMSISSSDVSISSSFDDSCRLDNFEGLTNTHMVIMLMIAMEPLDLQRFIYSCWDKFIIDCMSYENRSYLPPHSFLFGLQNHH